MYWYGIQSNMQLLKIVKELAYCWEIDPRWELRRDETPTHPRRRKLAQGEFLLKKSKWASNMSNMTQASQKLFTGPFQGYAVMIKIHHNSIARKTQVKFLKLKSAQAIAIIN